MMTFTFPPISPDGPPPRFNQGEFSIGGETCAVLDYLNDKNNFGWNDGLTAFHEDAAGDHHFIDIASRRHAINELQQHLKSPNATLLEVGCSSGFMLQDMQLAFPHAMLIGADIVKEPLQQLSKKMSAVPLLRFDLTKCPLASQSIDAIVLLNVLEHIEDHETAFAQINRILKPGGVAVIEVPAGPHLYDIYDKMLLHFRRYQLSQLKKLSRAAGFKVQRATHLGCFLYPGFWFVKKRNRMQYKNADTTTMQQTVAKNIRTTKDSGIMKQLMQLELTLGKWVSYPFGIRCLITCIKS